MVDRCLPSFLILSLRNTLVFSTMITSDSGLRKDHYNNDEGENHSLCQETSVVSEGVCQKAIDLIHWRKEHFLIATFLLDMKHAILFCSVPCFASSCIGITVLKLSTSSALWSEISHLIFCGPSFLIWKIRFLSQIIFFLQFKIV